MNIIEFSIWADSEEHFRQAWIKAGILENTEGYVFKEAYPGIELTILQGWSGIIIDPVTEEIIPGWHCNARVEGPLVEVMTQGLPQYDNKGTLLPLMDRTWAAYIFDLTEDQKTNPESGFRYQAHVVDKTVQYGDPRDLSSPSNVRQ